MVFPFVGSVVIDVSAFGPVIVVSPVVLPVTIIIITLLYFTDSSICVDVVIVIDEYSTLPEVSVIGSDCIVW